MARVYLETSFISACVTNRTDPASIYRRDASREWWDRFSNRHELFVSEEVAVELSNPRYPLRSQALQWVENVASLPISEEVRGLARLFVQQRVMPGPATGDSVHIAAACIYNMEYVLSWNVRHLANANKLEHLRVVCLRAAVLPPRIITPDLLWEDQ